MSSELVRGFGVALGLIVAIGAQNAFIIARAVRGDRPVLVATICALCDILLLTLAVTGAGATLARYPMVAVVASWGGVAFLVAFGARSFRSAMQTRGMPASGIRHATSVRGTVIGALAVSLLNPHAFLDTFVLIAGITAPLDASARHSFGLGACMASVTWFTTLAFAGRRLAPLFRKPSTWRRLDLFVGATMWTIAAFLLADLVA